MNYQIINGYDNSEVISFYLKIVFDSMLRLGENVEFIHDISSANKNSIVFVSSPVDAVKLRFKGFKHIFLWQQGIGPEESYLRHHNSLRRWLYYLYEKIAFSSSEKILFVSNKMKEEYEKKFKKDYSEKSFIMPCFSANYVEDSFFEKKYKSNTFAYVGSLTEWQCFTETLEMYKNISTHLPDSKLFIFTFDVEKAKKLVSESKIDNCIIECVSNSDLLVRMREIKFGFVLRKNNLVNNVATPTKLSTYLSCGVIPIFTNAICDFSNVVRENNMKYAVMLEDVFSYQKVLDFCENTVDINEIKEEYSRIFNDYYNRNKYVEKLSFFWKK